MIFCFFLLWFQDDHPISEPGLEEACKEFFQEVEPVDDIEIYAVANTSDVPYDFYNILDVMALKKNTTICYSPNQTSPYGWCKAVHPQTVTIRITFLHFYSYMKLAIRHIGTSMCLMFISIDHIARTL